ncbi:Peptidyl-prolyl cis-trans isomerase CYP57 [Linum perenne]
MSSIYVLEPPTKGKVVLNTTHGPIDIELWPKEAPKAVRNFVQLCLEGYYDSTIFHRIIKGFIIQGGDPTGTGTGGESIYGGSFSDEFHSRLRFNHRGIVACANAGTPHSNGSQFFMTLDKSDWLDRKNTIFGKVTGDSIYNLLTIGEIETGKDDRPLDPIPKIKSVEVLWNPFDDIVPRVVPTTVNQSSTDAESNKDLKRKPVKKLNLLSFGEEAEEEEKELAAVKQKIKSSHDVLNDPRLLKENQPVDEQNLSDAKATREQQLSVRETLKSKKEGWQRTSGAEDSNSDEDDDNEANFDARMRRQLLKKRQELGEFPSKQKKIDTNLQHDITFFRSNAESSEDDKPKLEKLSLKKKGTGSEVRAQRMATADTELQLYGEVERGRLLQKQKKRRIGRREDEVCHVIMFFAVLAKLERFTKTISEKANASNSEPGDGHKEDLSDWTSVQLKFSPERGKDKMSRKDDPDDYVVHDPLLEKGKEKFNRMQAKQKRREREWAGRSLT